MFIRKEHYLLSSRFGFCGAEKVVLNRPRPIQNVAQGGEVANLFGVILTKSLARADDGAHVAAGQPHHSFIVFPFHQRRKGTMKGIVDISGQLR